MVDLGLHDAGDLAVPLRAAPHLTFRPQGMLAQFVDGGVVIGLHLIGQWQIAWVEYSHLGAEQDQQPCRFLDSKPAERPLAERTVEQQDARRMIERTEPRREIRANHVAIERRREIGVGKDTKT